MSCEKVLNFILNFLKFTQKGLKSKKYLEKVKFIHSFKIWGHLIEDELKYNFSELVKNAFLCNNKLLADFSKEILAKIGNLIKYWEKNYFSKGSKYGYLYDWSGAIIAKNLPRQRTMHSFLRIPC